jgi:hypothetical protein
MHYNVLEFSAITRVFSGNAARTHLYLYSGGVKRARLGIIKIMWAISKARRAALTIIIRAGIRPAD